MGGIRPRTSDIAGPKRPIAFAIDFVVISYCRHEPDSPSHGAHRQPGTSSPMCWWRRAVSPFGVRSHAMKRRRNDRRGWTVLIPLDGSTPSERALRQLSRVLGRPTDDVILLQVVGPAHAGALVRGDDAAAYSSRIDECERARRYLEGVQRKLARRKVRSRVFVRRGDPATAILTCARAQHAALILMSTHGRRGIRRALLGSVAESVLRGATIPILLVPPERRRGI